MQAAATFDTKFDPHRRAKWVGEQNIRDSQREYQSGKCGVRLPSLHDSLLVPLLAVPSTESLQPVEAPPARTHPSNADDAVVLRKRKSDVLHTQWRVGAAPCRPLALSPTYTSFEHILLRTDAYYTSRFDSVWQPQLQRHSQALDVDGRIALLYESNLTIAGLIEAGRPAFANLIIERNLSAMEGLLRSEHPRLYSVLSVMALDTTNSVLGQYHRQFSNAVIPLARNVLGEQHPCTLLLQCDVPQDLKARLREAVQKRIHELLLATFGDVHQTYEGAFIVSRILAQLGHADEALGMLAWIKPRWECQHGMNSMLAVWTLLDEAWIYLGAGDAGIRTEMIISDALRRMKIMASSGGNLSPTDKQKHEQGLAYQRVGGLRALGRMHSMRRNYGAALEVFRQAANMARGVLGSNAPPTQLAQGDLDRARDSGLGTWTADYRLSGDEEEEVEEITTMLGKLWRSKALFGQEAVKVPVDKAPTYGFVPYEDLGWREGLGSP